MVFKCFKPKKIDDKKNSVTGILSLYSMYVIINVLGELEYYISKYFIPFF